MQRLLGCDRRVCGKLRVSWRREFAQHVVRARGLESERAFLD